MSLYEVNITINIITGTNYIKWMLFCRDNNLDKIILHPMSDKHYSRYIISKWCYRKSFNNVFEYAQELVSKIQSNNFQILRTRISGNWRNNINEKILYNEYTFKVNVNKPGNFDKLCTILSEYPQLIIESRNDYVCVTIRKEGIEETLSYKNFIIERIKNNDLHISGCIIEKSILYDDNLSIDDGLF